MSALRTQLHSLASSFALDVVRTIRSSSTEELESSAEYARYLLALSAPFLPPNALEDLKKESGAPPPVSGAPSGSTSTSLRPGVEALFGADTAVFLKERWPHRFFMKSGHVDRLAGLVDHSFEELVGMKKAYTNAFFRNPGGSSVQLRIAPGQERALYDAGFTIYFHSLRSSGIATWIEALEKDLGLLGGVTRVSAFASRRGRGLDAHYDQNDNFVCHARGAKRWRIAPNMHVRNPTVGYALGAEPTARQAIEAPQGFPSEFPEPSTTVDMSPGTVMFLPRGMWHDTETVDDESLHFNIQSGFATWKDAIEFLLLEGPEFHREELREAMKYEFDADELRQSVKDELKNKLQRLIQSVHDGTLTVQRRAFERYVASKRNTLSE